MFPSKIIRIKIQSTYRMNSIPSHVRSIRILHPLLDIQNRKEIQSYNKRKSYLSNATISVRANS